MSINDRKKSYENEVCSRIEHLFSPIYITVYAWHQSDSGLHILSIAFIDNHACPPHRLKLGIFLYTLFE